MKADFVGELAGHSLTKQEPKEDGKKDGLEIAEVIANCDTALRSRVQVRLACAPGLDPWVPVSSPMAGINSGMYAMPQPGEQVLVGFRGGDVNDPYIVGSVHKTTDLPPVLSPTEAMTKRILRTPLGHEIEFDDATQALTITSSTKQKVRMGVDSVELSAGLGAASIEVRTDGTLSITGAVRIELNAPAISLNGATVDIKAATAASLNGGASCSVQGAIVRIN